MSETAQLRDSAFLGHRVPAIAIGYREPRCFSFRQQSVSGISGIVLIVFTEGLISNLADTIDVEHALHRLPIRSDRHEIITLGNHLPLTLTTEAAAATTTAGATAPARWRLGWTHVDLAGHRAATEPAASTL